MFVTSSVAEGSKPAEEDAYEEECCRSPCSGEGEEGREERKESPLLLLLLLLPALLLLLLLLLLTKGAILLS